jgi:hypothetical protein
LCVWCAHVAPDVREGRVPTVDRRFGLRETSIHSLLASLELQC